MVEMGVSHENMAYTCHLIERQHADTATRVDQDIIVDH
jgi:hypothetical protein